MPVSVVPTTVGSEPGPPPFATGSVMARAVRSLLVFSVVGVVFSGTRLPGADAVPTGYAAARRARNDNYDFRFKLSPAEGEGRFDSVDLVFGCNGTGDRYGRFIWDKSGARFSRISKAGEVTVARASQPLPDAFRRGGELWVKRHPRWLEFTADGVRLLRVLDDTVRRGTAALRAGPGQAVAATVGYQRIEPVVFGDDFMRTEEETKDFGLWTPKSGEWKLYSVMERVRANPDARIREGREPDASRSPNPFCLAGKSTKGAVILTGYPFWDDYRIEVSCKTTGGWMGVVFGATNEKDFWLVRWRVATIEVAGGPVELVRRTGDRERVIAAARVKGRTDNWYRLSVTAVGSRIDIALDGTRIIEAWDDRSVGGRIGLYASSAGETYFDDVTVRSWPSVRFDHRDALAGASSALAGTWDVQGPPRSLRFQTREGDRPAVYALGLPTWTGGCFQATVRTDAPAAGFGLGFGLSDVGDWWRAVWDRRGGGELRLERVRGGKVSVLDAVPCPRSTRGERDGTRVMVDLREKTVVKVYVDDRLEVRTRIPAIPSGRFALTATGTGAVEFADVEAFAEPVRDWEHPVKSAIFAADPYMQGWSSPRWAWEPLTQTPDGLKQYVYKGDFYGAFWITLPISHRAALLFGLDNVGKDRGYRVQAHLEDNRKQGRIRLTRNGKKLAEGAFKLDGKVVIPGEQIIDEKIGALPKAPDTVEYGRMTVSREGPYIWVDVDGKELFSYRDPNPLQGRAVGLEVLESLDLAKVEVHRDHVKDYQFERVAADWLKVGTWAVTNRFACDPRWSFLNGRSKGVAALWNKFKYDGDFTVEYYAGMRMRQGEMHEGAARSYYPRVGDINLALCAGSGDLFSGYDLVLQAWDPMWSERWTQFLRRGRIVAKVDREFIPRTRFKRPQSRAIKVDWDPGGRPIHGAWYYVKVRRTGNRFDVWFDNVPVFSYTDAGPLKGNRIALWTQHNSIVVARARICYSRIDRSGALLAAAPEGPQAATSTEPSPPGPVLVSKTHWGRRFVFDRDTEGWRPFDGDQSAGLRLVPGGSGRGAHSLELTNLYGGGDFGVVLPVAGVDLGRIPAIEMDCAIPPDVKVNLYLTFKSDPTERFFVTLSGPDTDGPELVRLGKFEGAKADGQWHRVRFNPAVALRRLRPERDNFVVDSMVLGMFHEGYLNAGLGGNPQGATYRVDNVDLAGLGPMRAEFPWAFPGTGALTFRAVAARVPTPDLSRAETKTGTSVSIAFPAPGLWYICAETKQAGGAWRPAPRVPVWADRPLAVVSTAPAAGKEWNGGPIEVRFTPDNATNLLLSTLDFTANGRPMRADAVAAAYDPAAQVLRIDPTYSDLTFADGATVAFKLTWADALSGTKTAPRICRWTARMNWKQDRFPPGRVRMTSRGGLYRDFDTGLEGVAPYSSAKNVRLALVPRRPGSRDMALSITNRLSGSDFGVKLSEKKFSAGRFPILTFDYRLDPYATVDFLVTTEMGTYVLGLGDTDTDKTKLGEVQDVKKDGRWHHAEVDIAGLLARIETSFHANRYSVTRLALGDWGYAAAPPGARVEIDNLATVPVVAAGEGLTLSWTTRDPAGIRAYSYVWSRDPEAPVDEEPETVKSTGLFNNLPEGDMFFRIRACDNAGNWGPVTTCRFRIDNTPPAVVAASPAPDTGAADSEIRVRFSPGVAQIDPSSLALTMNGQRCVLSRAYTSWDAQARELTWNWVRAARLRPLQTADGARMAFKLSGIRDFAGNEAPAYEWTWRIDYSKDRKGPDAPRLYSASGKLLRFSDFSDGLGAWRAFGRQRAGTKLSTVTDPDTGDACLSVVKTGKGRAFAAYGYAGRLNTDIYPFLTFDLKVPKDVKVNLILHLNGEWRYIRLTGKETLPEVGRIDGVAADGKWHQVWVDLPEVLKKSAPKLRTGAIRYVALGSWGQGANPVGSKFYVDNFGILGPGAPVPEVYCSAADPTGIQGYSIALDRNPRSVAPADEKNLDTSRRPTVPAPTQAGLWYIHARALDGAGNWGATAHAPYYCPTPVLANAGDGIEGIGTWRVRGDRGGSGVARIARAVGTGNAVLSVSLRVPRKGSVRLEQRGTWTLPTRSVWRATLFQNYDDPIRIAPYVRLVSRKRGSARRRRDSLVTGKSIQLPPGRWVRDLRLDLDIAGIGADTVRCRERGLVVTIPGRARSVLIVDDLRITPAKVQPARPVATKQAGKK
ncbi:MAG: Ig-like domain-containing protein [Kiritimatiellaeota bacterium]|nr:Ig-like domain-containing protein [Kiritimatiellota bacterium]